MNIKLLFLISHYCFSQNGIPIKKKSSEIFILTIPFPILNINPSQDFYMTSDLSNSLSYLIEIAFYKSFASIPSTHWALRMTEHILTSQFLGLIDYFAHEFGHQRIQYILSSKSKIGMQGFLASIPFFPFLRLIGSDWIYKFDDQKVSHLYFVKNKNYAYNYNNDYLINYSVKKRNFFIINTNVGGLVQEIHRASQVYENTILKGSVSLVDAHIMYSNLVYQTYYSINNWVLSINKEKFKKSEDIEILGDPYEYITDIKQNNLNIGLIQISLISLFSNLLNSNIYQYYYLLYQYIRYGKRSMEIIKLKNIVSNPLIRYWLTYDVDLLDIVLPFLNPFPIFLTLGVGISRFLFRSGIKIYFPSIKNILSFAPFTFINYLHYQKAVGFELGIDIYFHMKNTSYDNLRLFISLVYSQKDILRSVQLSHSSLHHYASNILYRYYPFYFKLGIDYRFIL